MPIDVEAALAAEPVSYPLRWNEQDVMLYHLALGAGARATDADELRYTYEQDLHVLPTFGVVAGGGVNGGRGLHLPGIDVDLTNVLHAGQEIEVSGPLPAAVEAIATSRVAAVYDKGSAAVIVLESSAADEFGRPLFTARSQVFVRGEGGFGGDRGPSSATLEAPDRTPDVVVSVPTLPQQALLYRLCGDRNPLHADPEFAKRAGFDRPILHGLCTFGMVCKCVVDTCLDGQVGRVAGYQARFVGVLFPGEPIRVRIWSRDDELVISAGAADRDDAPVLRAALRVRPD